MKNLKKILNQNHIQLQRQLQGNIQMFHVKHNNKDDILHVHIGDRTHAHAQAGRQAHARPGRRHAHAPDAATRRQTTGRPPAGHRRAGGHRAGGHARAGDQTCHRTPPPDKLPTRTSKQGQHIACLLLYIQLACYYICRLSYMYFSYYIYRQKNPKKGLTASSVHAILETAPMGGGQSHQCNMYYKNIRRNLK